MRSIPTALKEKLANRFKAENTNRMAKLRVVATQTSVNSLLSEPIHEDIAPAFGDVAVRQTAGESDLSLAYAICLDDGVAKVYKRKFPAGLEYPWEYQWTLGAATDVAIESNGVWKMNAEKEWYYLQTEEYPYNLICPFGALQRTFGRFARLSEKVDKDACIGCKLCEKACPSNAIVVSSEDIKAVINTALCHQCIKCRQVCPKNAINYKK